MRVARPRLAFERPSPSGVEISPASTAIRDEALRSFARALLRAHRLPFFFFFLSFRYNNAGKHSFQTQHCHESVSQDRMALMWRAQVVLAARSSRVLRRTCLRTHRRAYRTSTPRRLVVRRRKVRDAERESGLAPFSLSLSPPSSRAYLYTVAKFIIPNAKCIPDVFDVPRARSI